MKAKVIYRRIDARTTRLELRAGAKGTGKFLYSCTYWPDSPRSVAEAERHAAIFARQHDLTVTQVPADSWQ